MTVKIRKQTKAPPIFRRVFGGKKLFLLSAFKRYVKIIDKVGSVAKRKRPPIRRACKMFYVYILKSRTDKKLYTGFSADLKERIKKHNVGESQSTKWRLPVDLIYYEGYISEKDARRREVFLKSGRGREVIKKQLENSLK